MTFGAESEDAPAEPFRIPFSTPDLGLEERELLLTAFDTLAPGDDFDVRAFEEEMAAYLGGGVHGVACSSDTAAMQLALVAAGVERGDDVLCAALAPPPAASALDLLGAHPIPVDVDPSSWTLDPDQIQQRLREAAEQGRRPAAIVVTDLYGQCADHDGVRAAVQDHPVSIVEDASQALGARYGDQHAGTLGDVAVLSFDSEQLVTTSTGGMVLTRDATLADRLRRGQHDGRPAEEPIGLGGFEDPGMSSLLAAVGRAQLRSIHDRLAHRRQTHEWYRERLTALPVTLQEDVPDSRGSRWCTAVTLEDGVDVARVLGALAAASIEARAIRSSPLTQPQGSAPATAIRIAAGGLCLPSNPSMTSREVDDVCGALEMALGTWHSDDH